MNAPRRNAPGQVWSQGLRQLAQPSLLRNRNAVLPQEESWQTCLAYASLLVVSIVLRFWGLSRFNVLVFDEVYFANNGYDYLHNLSFFDIHPPLGKLLISLGMRIASFVSDHLALSDPITTVAERWTLPTWHYRWLNAAIGSTIPLLGSALTHTLTRKHRYALMVGWFMALDGLLLVESRYALLNIYLIFFGLCGHWIFLSAILRSPAQRSLWPRWLLLTLSGIFLGACVSIKWNGLGFLLAIYLLWGVGMGLRFWQQRSLHVSTALFPQVLRKRIPFPLRSSTAAPNLLVQVTALRPYHLLLYLGAIPAIVYRLQWIPHLQINPDFNFWEVHQQIWGFNLSLGSGQDIHPYCSTWNSWPWLWRPVAYFFKTVNTPAEAVEHGISALQLPRIYDVHALGNPLLWWLSNLAIAFIMIVLIHPTLRQRLAPTDQGFLSYCLISYGANWLPWASVSRCLYLYHYMAASLFGFCILAWCTHRGLHAQHRGWQLLSWGLIALVSLSFLYWLPLYLGLPLTPEAFHERMWFRSWY